MCVLMCKFVLFKRTNPFSFKVRYKSVVIMDVNLPKWANPVSATKKSEFNNGACNVNKAKEPFRVVGCLHLFPTPT